MNLMHFSNAGQIVVESRAQMQGDNPCVHRPKPNGFWVSDEESEETWGWSHWCPENMPDYLGANAFNVELAADANVLLLTTAAAIREFDAAFSADEPGSYHVRWDLVAERWQGIIITPYQWTLRLSDVDWYYGWDCASGCIWDASAIASVTPVAVEAVSS